MPEYSSYPFPIILNSSAITRNGYTNGDKVIGSVSFLRAPTLHIDQISIHFKGKIKCQVETGSGKQRRIERSKAILFHFCTTFPLDHLPSHGPESWPFSFDFPWVALPVDMPKPFPSHALFADSPGHQLPPSFQTSGQRQLVSYYLEVVAHDQNAIFQTSIKNRLPLSFAPSRPFLSPSLNLFPRNTQLSCVSRKLDPVLEEAARHLTIRQKTGRFFSNNEVLPISRFVVKSSVPRQLYAGSSLPIMIGIEHDLSRSTAPEIPVVCLCSIHVRLSAFTHARVPYTPLFSDMKSHTRQYKEKIQIVNLAPAIPLSEEMHLTEFIPRLALPQGLPATFKSYNLSRHYSLKVTAVLRCVDQEYDVQLTGIQGGIDLVVLPRIHKPWILETGEREQSAGQPDIEEELPPYQKTDPLEN
ncbi:hypothetical protein MMC13_006916 [Lambiella insularis]|nr:hypothetical protein [Lambiella insularis]